MSGPVFSHHIFFCVNQREGGAACCANRGSQEVRDHAKARIRALGLSGKGKVRVNNAGCLDHCARGPVIVVYPQGIWYTYQSKADVDEIIDRHVVKGEIVERLRLA